MPQNKEVRSKDNTNDNKVIFFRMSWHEKLILEELYQFLGPGTRILPHSPVECGIRRLSQTVKHNGSLSA